jgi:hypothetical protein
MENTITTGNGNNPREKDNHEAQLRTRDMYKLTPPSTYTSIFYTNPEITFLSGKPVSQPNHSREFISIRPETDPTFSSTTAFKIEKKFDILERLWIKMRLPSLFNETIIGGLRDGTITYTDNTQRYEYINGIGYYLFRFIQLKVDGVVVQEITPEQLHLYHIRNNDSELTYLRRSQYHGYFGSKGVYSQVSTTYNPEYLVEIPLFFSGSETDKLPIPTLKNKSVELVVSLRDLDDLWFRPFVQENICDLLPYGETAALSTGNVTAKQKGDMIIEEFELLGSVIYVDLPLREAIVKADIQKEFVFYQQFEETFQSGGLVNMEIEPTGVARKIYIFARTKANADAGDFVNWSKEYQSVNNADRDLKPLIKNATLSINRERVFLAKKRELFEYQEGERALYFQNTTEPFITISLLNEKTNGSIIWERFDDIRLQINLDTTEEVTMYVVCENSNIIRFFNKQGGLLFG